MENVIELRKTVARGISTGIVMDVGLEDVLCNGHIVGRVGVSPGSIVQFARILSGPTREEIRAKVAALREKSGGNPIGEKTVQPVAPDRVRRYLDEQRDVVGVAEVEEDDDE